VPRAALEIEDRILRRLAIAEALAKAGYDPDEPRDEHGRWTSEGGGGDSNQAPQGQLAADPDRRALCVERCYRILLRPKRLYPGDRNQWDYLKCYDACMREGD